MMYNTIMRAQLRTEQKSDAFLMFERSLKGDASYPKIVNAYARILQLRRNLPFQLDCNQPSQGKAKSSQS